MGWLTPTMQDLLLDAFWETLVMVGASAAIAVAVGLPLALLLQVTGRGGLRPLPWLNRPLGLLVNAARSTPFIILMVAIVPLALAATAFLARLFKNALREVDAGVVEAARAMGASRWQIVTKVLVPEALPGLIAAITVTLVSVVGFPAMAGAIGGGGLGDLGIRFGYQRSCPRSWRPSC